MKKPIHKATGAEVEVGDPVIIFDLPTYWRNSGNNFMVTQIDYERAQITLRSALDGEERTLFSAAIAGIDWKETVQPVAPKFLLVEGNPVEGFHYYGPFNERVEAEFYARRAFEKELQWTWWIAPLETPT